MSRMHSNPEPRANAGAPQEGAGLVSMATSHDPRPVERDRDAHLAHNHPGALVEARLLWISHWPAGVRHVVTV